MPDVTIVNGEFVQNAKIDIDDRGNLFGDGIYEVIRTYSSVPFCLDEHLLRLANSAKEIRLNISRLKWDLKELILKACRKSEYESAKIYIQISRGVAPRDHKFPDSELTLILTVRKLSVLPKDIYRFGVSAITTPDIRWNRCDIKSLNLLANVLAKQQAIDSGTFEAIFHKEGLVTEGSISNIFMVKDKIIHTPIKNNKILAGVTREQVLRLCNKLLPSAPFEGVSEKNITIKDLLQADELFLTGTTLELVPIVKVDDSIISDKPGEIFNYLYKEWQKLVDRQTIT